MSDSREKLLKFLNKETKKLLNSIYDGVYIVDRDRNIVFWNKGAEEITGFNPAEVIGKSCKDGILNHVDENGRPLCQENCPLISAIYSDKQIKSKVFPLHKEKYRIPVSTHAAPIKDENGRIIGAIEVFRDISTEEKLRVLQDKFEKLIKQYVSKRTYNTIIESLSENKPILATRRKSSVLFMDIVGFTTISETYRPEEIVELLNTFFSFADHTIKQHFGDIDKFIGDGIMAVFIDAQDAVDAAKAFISEGLTKLNSILRQKGLPSINVRIGINTGILVQGDIGSDSRRDMTVIGDAVNTAARIEKCAEPGNFMISESTLTHINNKDEFEFAYEIVLKGKHYPVKLYRFTKPSQT